MTDDMSICYVISDLCITKYAHKRRSLPSFMFQRPTRLITFIVRLWFA